MIVDDVVVNVCLWDGDTDSWQPPDGALMERYEGQADMRWSRVDGQWVPPTHGIDEAEAWAEFTTDQVP
jgi:hypothetical protein